jgi:carboxymethylenebutenolidase
MCDEKTFADQDAAPRPPGHLTRREFGVLTAAGAVGTGLGMLHTDPARGAEDAGLEQRDVLIETPDGQADGYFVHPADGPHPGVLLWPDAFGLRPAMRQMAARLAASGYAVLAVNPYYRKTRAPILPDGADFTDPDTRKTIMSMMSSLDAGTHETDARSFVDYLDAQPAVAKDRKLGTMGYCMGGPITMRTAATRPDRIGAAASFHGGRLVTDAPDSPHLRVPEMKAQYLFAIAANDDEAEPHVKDVLRETFEKNGLKAEIEVYDGALHGWCPPDSRVYNEAQAERAWARLLALLERALGPSA